MRRLYLLRHFKSSWDDPAQADFDRPLAPRGSKAGQRMAVHLRRHRLRPDLILCSAAARARASLELTGLAGMDVAIERGLYEASAASLLQRLRQVPESVGDLMLIGHNPGIEQLAMLLCGNQGEPTALRRLTAKYPTGGLAELACDVMAWGDLAAGTCRLAGFVRPADLMSP